MWLENAEARFKRSSSDSPETGAMIKGRNDAEAVWRSGAWGSILARMRLPTQPPDGSAARRHGADGALEPAPPAWAVPTA